MTVLGCVRKTGWLALAVVVGLSFSGCPLASEPSTPIGKWKVTFDWGCDNIQKGTTTFRVFDNFRFTDEYVSGNSNGDWESAQNQVTFWYDNGTVYAGVLDTATTMSGTMERFDGLEGCWTAIRQSDVP